MRESPYALETIPGSNSLPALSVLEAYSLVEVSHILPQHEDGPLTTSSTTSLLLPTARSCRSTYSPIRISSGP